MNNRNIFIFWLILLSASCLAGDQVLTDSPGTLNNFVTQKSTEFKIDSGVVFWLIQTESNGCINTLWTTQTECWCMRLRTWAWSPWEFIANKYWVPECNNCQIMRSNDRASIMCWMMFLALMRHSFVDRDIASNNCTATQFSELDKMRLATIAYKKWSAEIWAHLQVAKCANMDDEYSKEVFAKYGVQIPSTSPVSNNVNTTSPANNSGLSPAMQTALNQASVASTNWWTYSAAQLQQQINSTLLPTNQSVLFDSCLNPTTWNYDQACVNQTISAANSRTQSLGSASPVASSSPINTSSVQQQAVSWIVQQLTSALWKKLCPYFYSIFPNGLEVFNWAFLVWKILSSMQGDSYDTISFNQKGLETSSWHIVVKVAEQLDETLYLDKAQLIKINHPLDSQAILDINWNPVISQNLENIAFNKTFIDEQTIIKLPKFRTNTNLVILGWITGNTGKLKQLAGSLIPPSFKDPIYSIIEDIAKLSSALEWVIKDYEGITLEECLDDNCREIANIITYPQALRSIPVEANKSYILKYSTKIVDVNLLMADDPIDDMDWSLEVLTQDNDKLTKTDKVYKVLNKWDYMNLDFFDVNYRPKLWYTQTYFLHTNWYYHPKWL